MAEFEKALMPARQRVGIAQAKAEGKHRGKVPTAQRQAESAKPSDIAKRLGMGRASVYRAGLGRRTEPGRAGQNLTNASRAPHDTAPRPTMTLMAVGHGSR